MLAAIDTDGNDVYYRLREAYKITQAADMNNRMMCSRQGCCQGLGGGMHYQRVVPKVSGFVARRRHNKERERKETDSLTSLPSSPYWRRGGTILASVSVTDRIHPKAWRSGEATFHYHTTDTIVAQAQTACATCAPDLTDARRDWMEWGCASTAQILCFLFHVSGKIGQ